jgi:hypothetical protein
MTSSPRPGRDTFAGQGASPSTSSFVVRRVDVLDLLALPLTARRMAFECFT